MEKPQNKSKKRNRTVHLTGRATDADSGRVFSGSDLFTPDSSLTVATRGTTTMKVMMKSPTKRRMFLIDNVDSFRAHNVDTVGCNDVKCKEVPQCSDD